MLIDSPTNPLVKTLRSLELPRSIKERGLFVVEGVRAMEDGLAAGDWPQICLYNPDLLRRTTRGADLLRRLTNHGGRPPGPAPVEASQRALEAAALTQHPQGVVAAFAVPHPELPRLPRGTALLALICDDIRDPGNLGTILRTAEAAGAHAVWLSPGCVYAYSPKVVRAATGSHFRLPVFPDSEWAAIGEALAQLGPGPGRVFVTEASATLRYFDVDWRLPSVLVVSNEAHGLTAEAEQFARTGRSINSISIPMAGGTESLNASIAAAVILFEAARQRVVQREVAP